MTTQTKPIELHSLPTPNGQKISIMLEELGVPYTYFEVNISTGDQFKPEFLAISPNNKIPAILDPEGPGGEPISVFESGAILKYLALKFERFYPKDLRAQTKVDEWLFWQVGGLGPMLGQYNHFAHYAPVKVEYAIKRYGDEMHRLYRVLDKQLEGQDFIAGDYSIADIASYGWASGWERRSMDIGEFPNVKAWLERMQARPAVARGMEVGRDGTQRKSLADDKEAQKILFNQR